MVTVASSVALCAAVAAAASSVLVQAAPLEFNPYTPVELNAPLTSSHPAYGAKTKGNCVKPVIPLDPNAQSAAARKLRDMEASGSDMDDLASFFGEKLEVDFKTLQSQYAYASASRAPWPGSYWPTFQDGINHAWRHGEASASEKYAKAFGLDTTDLKNKISASNGVDSCNTNTPCSSDGDCPSGVPCAKRDGASSGYCVPTWYGICHAWAPAALLEEEPKCNVEKNGVTFRVMDIKALLTEVYDGADIDTVFTGARFNGPDSPATEDEYGRFTDPTRRDIGAGFFHIAITNIMGKHQTPFIIDVAADSEVWNQPVWSYHVQTMEIVDTAETCNKYFGTTSYPFNAEIVQLAYVKTTVMWAVEAYIDGPLVSTGKVNSHTVSNDYEYLLELDANNAIIGGEWVGDSKEDHPDFLWFATSKPDISTVTGVGLKYADVRDLLELSLACNSTNDELPTIETNDTTPEATTPTKTKGDNETGKGKTAHGKATIAPTESTPIPTTADDSTPIPTTASPEQESTPAPTTELPVDESTVAPTSTPSTPYDSTDAPTATEGATETEAPTPAPTTSTPEQESTPAPTTELPVDESTVAPTSTPSTPYDSTDAPTATEGATETEAPTPAPTTSTPEQESTPAPTTELPVDESTVAPTSTPSTPYDSTDAPTATEGATETEAPTPAPTTSTPEQESTPAPTTELPVDESTVAPTSTPSTPYDSTDAPTATEGATETEAPTPAPTTSTPEQESTPAPTTELPVDESTVAPTSTPSTPYDSTDAPTATKGATETEAPTSAPTTSTPEQESTPAPTTELPVDESTVAPTSTPSTPYDSTNGFTVESTPVSTNAADYVESDATLVPSTIGSEGNGVYAPESPKLQYSATTVPSAPFDSAPVPSTVADETDEAFESPKLEYSPFPAPTIPVVSGEGHVDPAAEGGEVYAPESEIPSEIVTSAPSAPISQLEQAYPVQSNQGQDDYRQTDVSGEHPRTVDQPMSVQHPSCG